jgi:tRNA-dihydrouridine synthase
MKRKLPFKNKYLLAPMLEPNDIAFRILCKKAGCGLTYTGMTSPLSEKKLFLEDKPAIHKQHKRNKRVHQKIR